MSNSSSVSKLLELVKKTDLYSSGIDVAFENGKRSLKSWFGVCVGLSMTVIIVFYAHLKLEILLNYQDITIMEPTMRNHFNDSYAFGSQ